MLVSIEKIYQTLKSVFDHISKYLEVCQKYSAVRRIFNSLLGVWKCGQTQSFVFDILHDLILIYRINSQEYSQFLGSIIKHATTLVSFKRRPFQALV